jgi:hypothetical protein
MTEAAGGGRGRGRGEGKEGGRKEKEVRQLLNSTETIAYWGRRM